MKLLCYEPLNLKQAIDVWKMTIKTTTSKMFTDKYIQDLLRTCFIWFFAEICG